MSKKSKDSSIFKGKEAVGGFLNVKFPDEPSPVFIR